MSSLNGQQFTNSSAVFAFHANAMVSKLKPTLGSVAGATRAAAMPRSMPLGRVPRAAPSAVVGEIMAADEQNAVR